MSIGPGVMAAPLVNAPGPQLPPTGAANQAGGGDGASAHADFLSTLKHADPAQQVAAQPLPADRPGALAPRNTLGDQVLGGLEKLGRSVEAMQAMDAAKPATKVAAATARPSTAPPQKGAQQPGASNPLGEMRDLFETGLRHQSQVYATVFNFELIQETSQSMLKSLKSLLTQGGG